jgi:hypothetical protein
VGLGESEALVWLAMQARPLRIAVRCALLAALTLGAVSAPATAQDPAPSATLPGESPHVRIEIAAPRLWTGPLGGPFAPQEHTLELRNTEASPRRWRARANVDWMVVAPLEGELAANGVATLSVRVHAEAAAGLSAGTHRGWVELVDAVSSHRSLAEFFLVAVDDEWTKLEPSPDSRRVYVSSSSGDDFKDGRSGRTPKRTLAAAVALLRHGEPDWLLLKRGDTWTETLGHWKRSGRSAEAPMVITSYGDSGARPRLLTGADNGLMTLYAGDSPASIDHLAIVGLHMHAHTYVGGATPSAVSWLIASRGLTIEDCLFEGYEVNLRIGAFDGRKRNVRIRRNVLVDAFATSGTVGHGMYIDDCDHLVIEQNVFDRNGWNPAVPEAKPSMYRHGIYLQGGSVGSTNVLVRGNIIANSASHGLQMRAGGVALDNLFLRNSIALQLGGGDEPHPGGVVAIAHRNVILGGKDIDPQNPRGWGLLAENVSSATLSENWIVQRGEGAFPVPLSLAGDAPGVGVHNLWVRDNVVHGWGGSIHFSGDAAHFGPLWLERNRFHNALTDEALVQHRDRSTLSMVRSRANRFHARAPQGQWFAAGGEASSFEEWARLVGDSGSSAENWAGADAARTIASYQKRLGETETLDAFLQGARSQSRHAWQPRYTAEAVNAYVRASFSAR